MRMFDAATRHAGAAARPENVGVAIALVVLLATVLVHLRADSAFIIQPSVDIGINTARTETPSVARADYDLSAIANWHLFGETKPVETTAGIDAEKKADISTEPADEIPVSKTKWTLTGIVAATDVDAAHAIIAANGKQQKDYTIGDDIFGVLLYAIETNRVILKRDGQYEALTLPQPASPLAASGANDQQDRRVRVRRRNVAVADHDGDDPR